MRCLQMLRKLRKICSQEFNSEQAITVMIRTSNNRHNTNKFIHVVELMWSLEARTPLGVKHLSFTGASHTSVKGRNVVPKDIRIPSFVDDGSAVVGEETTVRIQDGPSRSQPTRPHQRTRWEPFINCVDKNRPILTPLPPK